MIPFPIESYTDALIAGDYLEEYYDQFEANKIRDKLRPDLIAINLILLITQALIPTT